MAPPQFRRRSAAKLRPTRFPLPAPRAARLEKLLAKAIRDEWERLPEGSAARKNLKPLALRLSTSVMAKITLNADVTTPSAPEPPTAAARARLRATAQRITGLTQRIAASEAALRDVRARVCDAQEALLETVLAVPEPAGDAEEKGAAEELDTMRAASERGLGELNEVFVVLGDKLTTSEKEHATRTEDLGKTTSSVKHALREAAPRETRSATRSTRVTRKTADATAALAEHLSLP